MKNALVKEVAKVSLIAAVLMIGSVAHAQAANTVQMHMKSITALVRSCVTQPYTFKADGTKVYSELLSHCLYVTIPQKGVAEIQSANRHYKVELAESVDSDADFYDVKISDMTTNDSYVIPQVLAYGDVLLGVLKGDIRDVPEVLAGGGEPIFVPNPTN